jgi:hypothetical protein
MQCTTCPEGYVCSVEKIFDVWQVLGVTTLAILVVLVLILAVVGAQRLLEG